MREIDATGTRFSELAIRDIRQVANYAISVLANQMSHEYLALKFVPPTEHGDSIFKSVGNTPLLHYQRCINIQFPCNDTYCK